MLASTVARAIFDQAGISPLSRDGVGTLALNLLGENALDYDAELREPARITLDPPRIFIRPDLSRPVVTMAIAWGIAQWWASAHRLPFGLTVDELAMAIALPEEALLEAIDELGAEIGSLAADFVCPESFVAERLRTLLPTPRRSGVRNRVGVAS